VLISTLVSYLKGLQFESLPCTAVLRNHSDTKWTVAGVNGVNLKQKPDAKIWNRLSQPVKNLSEGRLCINRGTFELYIEENCYPAEGGSMFLPNVRNNLQTRRCMALLEGVGVACCSCVTHCSVYTEDPNPNLHCPQVSTAMLRPDSHCQLPKPTPTRSYIFTDLI